ncbi:MULTISPECIES: UPF0149 family protein [Corallincola]|uniref:YecA family protein n=2 Tax=Corallincola TaxID=1775176 RepID=A0ABY1WLR5_9GAMM|nr:MULTISPECIES: UPF0149 family protein [Corallincola]TAA41793.1 YecA family protein [Corallincola spongiicola]TCI02216.1 YecA family protein [Corallincola luteus]
MSANSIYDFEDFSELLTRFQMLASAAEVHGVISGLVCGGTPLDGRSWRAPLADAINEGYGLPSDLEEACGRVYQQVCQVLIDDTMAFAPLLPDDETELLSRVDAMADWVDGFLAGFALACGSLEEASDELKEVLSDLSELTRVSLGDEGEDTEEMESAFVEVVEYLRVSAMYCFNEFGDRKGLAEPKPRLH